LSFKTNYNTEPDFDGGVLEISINGGAFQDILAAGGSFLEGGYNSSIGVTDSVLTGRQAWTGNSGGFISTTVVLPPASYGQNAQFRWRTAFDTGTSPTGGGLRIDTLSIFAATRVCCGGACVLSCPANISVPNTPGQCGAIVSFPNATFTGNCGTVTANPPSGSFFPVGTTTVVVTGQRLDGTSDTCSFTVTVNDTQPPVVSCSTTVTTMWPPDHCPMINVGLSVTASDSCPTVTSVKVYSDEDDVTNGGGENSPDALNIAPGTLRLRPERQGSADGRVYLIIVTVTDSSGNVSRCCRTVTIAKDQSKKSKDSVAAQAAAAEAYCQANGTPPPAFFLIGDGPVVGCQ
jgi:hypothetical protein